MLWASLKATAVGHDRSRQTRRRRHQPL